jgi:predicted DNA repair protein MutK
MKKKNVFNLAIGIFVILQSIFFPINFMTPILFILGILNLFIAFGGVEWVIQKYQERKEKKNFGNKNPF